MKAKKRRRRKKKTKFKHTVKKYKNIRSGKRKLEVIFNVSVLSVHDTDAVRIFRHPEKV